MSSGQTLEAIVIFLDEAGIHHLSPSGRETLRVAWDPDFTPAEAVVDAVAEQGLDPFMVHSTSWRVVDEDIWLTFIVVVEPPATISRELDDELVVRAELARGHLMGPPAEVHTAQVVEHGLRHLAWLVGDDEQIRDVLPAWAEALEGYEREPFRAL